MINPAKAMQKFTLSSFSSEWLLKRVFVCELALRYVIPIPKTDFAFIYSTFATILKQCKAESKWGAKKNSNNNTNDSKKRQRQKMYYDSGQ